MIYKRHVKRIFDFIFSFLCLILVIPFFIIIVIILSISNNGSPFFFQTRPGKNEKLFKIVKFKTMNDKRGVDNQLLPDAERLTSIGQFVRKTSLDEIPQLINVLKGDMSLIGPRPLLQEYIELYNDFQKRRHEVRPGITGWAQVNGRNAISWDKKFEYDVYYVDNQSFFFDIKIIIKTIKKVFISEGINAEGQVTTVKFNGSS